jgi:hypothetical protein
MDDFLKFIVGLAVAALAVWVFSPRTIYFGDKVIVYSFEASFCNEFNVCNVKQFFPPLTLRVDEQKSEIVWLNPDDGQMGSWTGCTIADKENWMCSFPSMRMVDGALQSSNPNIRYSPGYVYRLYWLASFLPDLRQKGGSRH